MAAGATGVINRALARAKAARAHCSPRALACGWAPPALARLADCGAPRGRRVWTGAGAARLSARGSRGAGTLSSSRHVSAMRLRGMSTSSTRTLTTSPALTTSRGSLTYLSDSAEMCTRPSWCTPMSTNAPNAATLLITPSRIMPTLRSLEFLDALGEARGLELGARVASGLLQFLQDVAHGRHAELVVGELLRLDRRAGTARRRSRSLISRPQLLTMRSTTG